jgi:hypothetical protein
MHSCRSRSSHEPPRTVLERGEPTTDHLTGEPPDARHDKGTLRVLMAQEARGASQGDGGGNVGEVAESLGKVPQLGTVAGVVFLRVETEFVGGGRRTTERRTGEIVSALVRQALGEPEGTGDEHSLAAQQAVSTRSRRNRQ